MAGGGALAKAPAPAPAADLAGLRITLLTASASRLGGGVASALHGHAAMLREAGAAVSVVALEDAYSEEDRPALSTTPLHIAPVTGPAMFGYSPGLLRRALETEANVLHLHGIWMYPSLAATQWAQRTGRPYLISPHGMLDPWITARGRWKKSLARLGYERASWRSASRFHALTEDEAVDIRREAGDVSVVVIPNAGPPALASAPGGRGPEVLYIGRIHPKKSLGALVAAWAAANLPEGAQLTIAGWGEANDVMAFEAGLKNAPPSIYFAGPVHGAAKQRLLEQARFVVLPSHSEGLPMAVLEAWAAGTPTLMTPACHLPEGFAAGAALECSTDPRSIAAALGRALRLDEPAWRAMSDAALGLARGPFSAGQVSGQWVAAYRALAAERPV